MSLTGLSVRARNILENNKITTFEQLTNISDCQLLNFKSMGKTTVREIRNYLVKNNIIFKPEVTKWEICFEHHRYQVNAYKCDILSGCLVFKNKCGNILEAYSPQMWKIFYKYLT